MSFYPVWCVLFLDRRIDCFSGLIGQVLSVVCSSLLAYTCPQLHLATFNLYIDATSWWDETSWGRPWLHSLIDPYCVYCNIFDLSLIAPFTCTIPPLSLNSHVYLSLAREGFSDELEALLQRLPLQVKRPCRFRQTLRWEHHWPQWLPIKRSRRSGVFDGREWLRTRSSSESSHFTLVYVASTGSPAFPSWCPTFWRSCWH
jgi:hypothetical protein